MKRTVYAATTAAILQSAAIPFTVKSGDFKSGKPSITIEGLATTETATICKSDGNGKFQIVRDGVIDHTNEGSVTLESPGEYGFFKDATAAACDVIVENSI